MVSLRPQSPSSSSVGAPTIGTPRPATELEKAWEKRATEFQLDELSRLRSVAEKWAGSITALLGVFGIAALVSGPKDLTKLSGAYPAAIGISLAVAIICGLVAMGLALAAAQGTPEEVQVPTGERVRKWTRQEVQTGRQRLSASRWLMLPSLLAVGLATGLLWYAPTSSAGETMIVTSSGGVYCGDVQVGKQVTLRVDDRVLRRFNRQSVTALLSVDECAVQATR